MTSGARFHVLGGVEVSLDGRRLPIGRRRERCLLGLLLLEAGRAVAVDRLVDLLWDGEGPAYARRSLHSHVARLRTVLSGAAALGSVRLDTQGTGRGAGYVLRVEPDTVDAHRFRRLVSEAMTDSQPGGRADGLAAALELWRGPVLGDDADSALRDRVGADLHTLHLSTLEHWAGALVAAGRFDEALPQLARLTVEHPARERFTELYMTALYRIGDKAAALAAYERTRTWLSEQIGVDPTPALHRHHLSVLRDEVAAATPATPPAGPAELPGDVATLVGREDELAALDGASGGTVCVVAGTAGVGKTALAVHFGRTVAGRFPDGQLFLDLRGYAPGSPMSPEEALTRLLGSLGVPAERIPPQQDAAAGLLRSCLAGKRVLLVLDNAVSAEQVRPLLPAAPRCLALVTSRHRLAGLIASHGASHLTVQRLDATAARRLLSTVVDARRIRREPEAVAEVARLCGHLPLALRVAAAYLATHPGHPIADYAAALRGDRLGMLEVDGCAAVRAALALSYARLSDEDRQLFRLLSLVPGPDTTVGAAAALAGIAPALAARRLDRLAAAHLVEECAPHRYALQDLPRAYAAEQASPDECAATGRLANWYLAGAARAAEHAYPNIHRLPATRAWAGKAEIAFGSESEAAAWLEAERANLVATVLHAAQHGPRPLAWLLADALRGHLLYRTHLADWLLTASAARNAAAAEGDVSGQAAAQLGIAGVSVLRSQHLQAIHDHRHAIVLSRRAGWQSGSGAAHNNIAIVYATRGDSRRTSTHLHAALAAYRAAGDVEGEAASLANLSDVALSLGRYDEAERLARRSLALRARRTAARGAALVNLANARRLLGWPDDAVEYASEALDLCHRSGMTLDEALAHDTLAAIHRDAGRHELALTHARAAHRPLRDHPLTHAQAVVLHTLGTVYSRLGEYRRAVGAHEQALELAQQDAMRYRAAHALVGLGVAYRGTGHHEQALSRAHKGLTVARKAGYRMLEGDALTTLAEIHHSVGSHDLASEHALHALPVHRETGWTIGEQRSHAILASTTG
ncbi:tetratricopeptide repeat protein [Micromonospora sp. CPCC 205371]|nr:tetratricopeptide repeat protein [Micromonospora sp. CPCC 205371]